MAGLQAQYAPSMYIGLWSRVDDFARDDLTRALEAREVIQATLMRSTIHLVSRADYWPFAIAVRDVRRASWLRAAKADAARGGRRDGPRPRSPAATRCAARRSRRSSARRRRAWSASGSTSSAHRRRARGSAAARTSTRSRRTGSARRPTSTRTPPSSTSSAATSAASAPPPPRTSPRSPASRPPSSIHCSTRLDLTREDDLLDLPGAPRPDPDTPAPPRFIGTWDASLLVHARRTGFLPEEHRPKIFHTKAPQSFPTFTVDGAVAGTWKYDKGRIELSPFGRLKAADRKALESEAERLAAFHSAA